MSYHVFDDLNWCTTCWRKRQDLVNQHILDCTPTNVVPLEHRRARQQMDRLADQVLSLLGYGPEGTRPTPQGDGFHTPRLDADQGDG